MEQLGADVLGILWTSLWATAFAFVLWVLLVLVDRQQKR